MTLILAGLASLTLSADPGFAARAASEYCVPFARGELSLEQAEARLSELGFTSEPLNEVSPQEAALIRRLSRPDGDGLWLHIDDGIPRCLAIQAGAGETELPDAIEATGAWSPLPHRTDHAERPWLSIDGRLILETSLNPVQGALAYVAPAEMPPEAMFALRDAGLAAARRSPGEALVWAVENLCVARSEDERVDVQFTGHSLTEGGGLRVDLRHRDPETLVIWLYAGHCMLGVAGPGQTDALADLRTRLDDPASGWSRDDGPDAWKRPGLTASLTKHDEWTQIDVRHEPPPAPSDE